MTIDINKLEAAAKAATIGEWKLHPSIMLELIARLREAEKQLNAKYGCESCPGMPTLTNPDVSRAAFKAVMFNSPEYFKEIDKLPLSDLEKELTQKYSDLLDALKFVHHQMQSGAWLGSEVDRVISSAIKAAMKESA